MTVDDLNTALQSLATDIQAKKDAAAMKDVAIADLQTQLAVAQANAVTQAQLDEVAAIATLVRSIP